MGIFPVQKPTTTGQIQLLQLTLLTTTTTTGEKASFQHVPTRTHKEDSRRLGHPPASGLGHHPLPENQGTKTGLERGDQILFGWVVSTKLNE